MKRLAGLALVGSFSVLSVASIFPPGPDPREAIEPPVWETNSDLALTIGRGWEDFRAYTDDQAIPVTSGFQGGQHVHVTLLSADLTADDVVERVLTWYVDAEDETLLDGAYEADGSLEPLPEELSEAGYGDTGGPFTLAFLEETGLVGRDVELRVHVELADGRIARASVRGPLEWEWDSADWSEWLCLHEGGFNCLDAGPGDGGLLDAGAGDGGLLDAGAGDAGDPLDAGPSDAGTDDGGPTDAGGADAGPADAGASDAG